MKDKMYVNTVSYLEHLKPGSLCLLVLTDAEPFAFQENVHQKLYYQVF